MKFLTNTFYFNEEYREGNKYRFTRSDSPEIYAKNRKNQDESWYYWDRGIEYTVNSDFYRNPFEFDEVDWSNAIVLFGCSRVLGIGLTDDDTIRAKLSNITGRPVVSMASSGTSIAWSFHNACILGTYYPKPWAVVNIWTGLHRIVEYNSSVGGLSNLGVWHVARPGDLLDLYTREKENPIRWAQFHSMASNLMWKDCKYLEYSSFKDTVSALNCKELVDIDLARDLLHPGIATTQQTAQIIAEDLKLL